MTKLEKAAKLALEALEGWAGHGMWVWPESALEQAKRNTKEAITALRQALAEQPAQQEQTDWEAVAADQALTIALMKVQLEGLPGKEQEPVAWAPRELELIDGMIETQLRHADVCDHIANRVMAQKQKGWDMERVELLRKIKNMPLKQEFVCSTGLCHYKHWVGLTDEEIFDVIRSLCADNETAEMLIHVSMDEYRAIEAKIKEKNT